MHRLNSEIVKPNARLALIKDLLKHIMLMWIYCGCDFVYMKFVIFIFHLLTSATVFKPIILVLQS